MRSWRSGPATRQQRWSKQIGVETMTITITITTIMNTMRRRRLIGDIIRRRRPSTTTIIITMQVR